MTITTVALLDMKTRLHDILADAIVQSDGLALVDWLPGSAPFPDSAGPDAGLPDVFVQEVADPRGTGLPAHLLQVRNGARVLLVSSSGTDAAIYQLRLDSSFIRDVALDELLAAIRFGVDGIGRDRPPRRAGALMYQVLSATSATLRQMIFDAMMSDAGPGGLASFFGASQDISLLSPREMRDATRDGLSIWLYSVERDDQRINEPPRTRVLPDGRLELQANPLPLRLHYLITPLATNAPDIEQRMLGRVMQLFHTRPAVSGALLRGELAGSDVELHVHLESLGLDQIARVWEALEGSYQLCISYEVSLARIEVSTDPVTLVPVETLRTDTAIVIERSAA